MGCFLVVFLILIWGAFAEGQPLLGTFFIGILIVLALLFKNQD